MIIEKKITSKNILKKSFIILSNFKLESPIFFIIN